MSSLLSSLKYYLLPGWPDDARAIIQRSVFLKILSDGNFFKGRCLNAGGGEGLFLNFLNSFPEIQRITDVDISPRSRFQNSKIKVQSIQGSLTQLPVKSDAFDCCLCTEVLEHIPEDRSALKELGRALKTGGLLLLSVPTDSAPDDPHHVRRGYSAKNLSGLLREHGFDIKKEAYCFHFFMNFFFRIWNWQFKALGRGRQSFVPRFIAILFGYLDRYVPIGNPWDLIILAEKYRFDNSKRSDT